MVSPPGHFELFSIGMGSRSVVSGRFGFQRGVTVASRSQLGFPA